MDFPTEKKQNKQIKESTDPSSRVLTPIEMEMFSKMEEKLKSEVSHNKEIVDEVDENQNNSDRSLYAYCSVCQDNIFIQYSESIIKNASSYPIYLVWVHGKPYHGLLVRIDKNFVSRGERVVHLEFDPDLSNHYG